MLYAEYSGICYRNNINVPHQAEITLSRRNVRGRTCTTEIRKVDRTVLRIYYVQNLSAMQTRTESSGVGWALFLFISPSRTQIIIWGIHGVLYAGMNFLYSPVRGTLARAPFFRHHPR